MSTETITNPNAVEAAQNDTLKSLLTDAAFAPLPQVGFLRVTGEDRVRWLNGMVTNSIQALQPGDGCYLFFLNAQGRIQADATAWLLEDAILLETQRDRTPALLAQLDRFIIMDDVELTPLPLQGLLIAGPNALSLVQNIGGGTACSASAAPQQLPTTLNLKHTTYHDAPVSLIQAHSPLLPRYEIWASPETIAQVKAELAPIPEASQTDLDAFRILEGTPLYGTDIRDKDLPQETAQTRALHFAKGCYLGQEIVERIRSRGAVHRIFSGFTLTGDLPLPGTALEAEGKPVGEITSAASIPLASGAVQIALGYIRREALERNLPIAYAGGSATPCSLPYRI
jgi:folate-binding protein YgfZ